MVIVLALDTATEVTSVAVAGDGQVLAQRSHRGAREHAEVLVPLIDDVLREASVSRFDLTDIAVGVGPGAYTGLRVGVATANTLTAVLPVRLHAVCTLDAMAAAAPPADEDLVVVVDARRRELFWARYDVSGSRLDGPYVENASTVVERWRDDRVVGAGGTPLANDFRRPVEPSLPDGRWLGTPSGRALLASPVSVAHPVYLRRADVTVSPKVRLS